MEGNTNKGRIFVKLDNVVKKLEQCPSSFAELIDTVVNHMFETSGLTPKYVNFLVTHPESRVQYQIESIDDLYENCIVEIVTKDRKFSLPTVKASRRIDHTCLMNRNKLVLVMVGLPARGKTYISNKIARYVNWLGLPAQVFNVGSYRRSKLGAGQPSYFFDPDNEQGVTSRLHMAVLALDDMFDWFHAGGQVGIYDATNTTVERRKLILSRCDDEGVKAIFIESICEDPDVIAANLKETKLRSPDFTGVGPDEAQKEFQNRIELYKKAYVPISTEEKLSYVKLIDVGKRIVVDSIPPIYLATRLVFFLMNTHINPRTIWLTRHGQSQDNLVERLGGDSALTPSGEKYAQALASWIFERTGNSKLTVWTSTLQRAVSTSQYIPKRKVQLRCLDEIDAGKCDGMTYNQIAEEMPEEFAARAADKLRYRYPQGESYEDVIERLEPVIFELERQRDAVLVIAHNAVIRCLYGYLANKTPEECPFLEIPLHTVIELTPRAYGCDEKGYNLVAVES